MANADGFVDPARLNESQQLALQTYVSITNQEIPAAISLLQRSQWNVQVRAGISSNGKDRSECILADHFTDCNSETSRWRSIGSGCGRSNLFLEHPVTSFWKSS